MKQMGRSEKLCIFSKHATDRMVERKIKKPDVLSALKNGIVIEVKENSKPHTHCLVLGHTSQGNPLHIAVALVPDGVLILTTYKPYAKIWGENFDKKVV